MRRNDKDPWAVLNAALADAASIFSLVPYVGWIISKILGDFHTYQAVKAVGEEFREEFQELDSVLPTLVSILLAKKK